MAWTFNSIGAVETSNAPIGNRKNNVFKIASETLTVATSDAAGQDLTSTVIDFIPRGADFLVIANSGATNLSSDADIAVLASVSRTGTFGVLKDDLITSMDAIVAAKPYIATSKAGTAGYGESPYYKLFVDSDGVQKKTDTIVLNVIWTE